MNDGLYYIAPIVDGAAAWPWAQLLIHSQAPGQQALSPEAATPSGKTGGAWIAPVLRTAGSNFEDETCI